MKKRILAILLAIALLSSVAGVVAYAAEVQCPQCGLKFSDYKDENNNTITANKQLEDHLKNDCKYTYQCAYCEKWFNNETTRDTHETACSKNPANVTKFYCSVKDCPYYGSSTNTTKYFTSAEDLENHMKSAHASSFKCEYCGLVFDTAADLQAHYDGVHKEDTNALHCPYKDCHYIAYSISDYNNHIAANHQKDGEQVTPRDNMQRFFDKYFMGIGLNVNENSFSSVVRIFAYVTEVFMSVFTDSGASEVFQFAGDSGVTYFFETIVPHFWALFTE